jgi:uncharacterized protein (PEP-CTERM system associated)
MLAMDMVQSTRSSRFFSSKKLVFKFAFAINALQLSFGVIAQVSLPGVEEGDDPAKNPLKRPGVTVLPGVRTTATYSDNLLLDRKGSEVTGLRLEVAPYILASLNSNTAQGYAFLALRSFYLTAGPNSGQFASPRHDFKTSGRYQLIENFLSLQGAAYTFDVNPINFGVTSSDSGNLFLYPRRIQGFNIGPTLQGQLGALANYSGGYSYGESGVAGDTNLKNQIVNGSVTSGSAFNRWGWEWNGLHQRRDFFGGGDFQRNVSNGILFWSPNESWKVGASIRYSQIDGFISGSGKAKGFGPGIAINWIPNARTQLKLTAAAEYFGTTGEFSITHSTPRLILDMLYEKGSLSSTSATLLNQNPSALTRVADGPGALSAQFQNYVAESLNSRYGVLTGFGVVDSAFVQRTGGRASASYRLSTTNKATLSYFNYNETTRVATSDPQIGGSSVTGTAFPASGIFIGDVERVGISFTNEIGLGARSKLGISINSYTNRFLSIGREVRIKSLSTTYSARVSPSTTALLGFRHSDQVGIGYQTISFGENSIFGAIDMRF